MNTSDKDLAHSIKMKFGTSPQEPSEEQLDRIKADLRALVARGLTPSPADWNRIVSRHCPSAGTYRYAGVDNSDLQTLLLLVTKPSK